MPRDNQADSVVRIAMFPPGERQATLFRMQDCAVAPTDAFGNITRGHDSMSYQQYPSYT
jgi:hypothetical protein